MQPMKFFIDTHDKRSSTFPAGISKEQFQEFFSQYEQASRGEGVVVLRAHVGLEDGRAFCFNMAPSAEHVRLAHEHAGLAFESITEVATATPGDLSFEPACQTRPSIAFSRERRPFASSPSPRCQAGSSISCARSKSSAPSEWSSGSPAIF